MGQQVSLASPRLASASDDDFWTNFKPSELYNSAFLASKGTALARYDEPALCRPPTQEELALTEPPNAEARLAGLLAGGRGSSRSKRGPPCPELTSPPPLRTLAVHPAIAAAPFFKLLKFRARLLNRSLESFLALPVPSLPSGAAVDDESCVEGESNEAEEIASRPDWLSRAVLRLSRQVSAADATMPEVGISSGEDVDLIASIRMSVTIASHLKDATLTAALFADLADLLIRCTLGTTARSSSTPSTLYSRLTFVLELAASHVDALHTPVGEAALTLLTVVFMTAGGLGDTLAVVTRLLKPESRSLQLSAPNAARIFTAFRHALINHHDVLTALPITIFAEGEYALTQNGSSAGDIVGAVPTVRAAIALSSDGRVAFVRHGGRLLKVSTHVADDALPGALIAASSGELFAPDSRTVLACIGDSALFATGLALCPSPQHFALLTSDDELAPVDGPCAMYRLCPSNEAAAFVEADGAQGFALVSANDGRRVFMLYPAPPSTTAPAIAAGDAEAAAARTTTLILDEFDISVLLQAAPTLSPTFSIVDGIGEVRPCKSSAIAIDDDSRPPKFKLSDLTSGVLLSNGHAISYARASNEEAWMLNIRNRNAFCFDNGGIVPLADCAVAYCTALNSVLAWDGANCKFKRFRHCYLQPGRFDCAALSAVETAVAACSPVGCGVLGDALLHTLSAAAAPYILAASTAQPASAKKHNSGGDSSTSSSGLNTRGYEYRGPHNFVPALIEPTLVVFERLCSLAALALSWPADAPNRTDVVTSTFLLLRAQLVDLLRHGGVPSLQPSFSSLCPDLFNDGVVRGIVAGNPYFQNAAKSERGALSRLLLRLRKQLLGIVQSPGGDIVVALAASELLVSGLALFFPSGGEQVELLTSLLRAGAGLSDAEIALLNTLMKSLSSLSSATSLLRQLTNDKTASATTTDASSPLAAVVGPSPLSASVSSLLDLSFRGATAALDALASDSTLASLAVPKAAAASTLLESLVKAGLALIAGAAKTPEPKPGVKPDEPSAPECLFEMISAVIAHCSAAIDSACAVLTTKLEPSLDVAECVDAILCATPVATVLPLIVSAFSTLGIVAPSLLLQASKPRGDVVVGGRAVEATFAGLFISASRLWSLLAGAGFEQKKMVSVTVTAQDTTIIESPHQYQNNTDVFQVVAVPNALGYTITFDPQSRTEAGCDYVTFFRDASNSSCFGENRYSGSTFPGINGTAPLEIDSPQFNFHFHSDGSNVDWGYKIACVAKVHKQETVPQSRLLHELQSSLCFLASLQVSTLLRSTPLVSAEEADKEGWLESALLAGGLADRTGGDGAAASGSALDGFLAEIASSGAADTPGAKFAALMRLVVPEDHGTVACMNSAVNAAAAAALKLAGLAGPAAEFIARHGAVLASVDHSLTGVKKVKAGRKLRADLGVPEPLVACWTAVQGLRSVIQAGVLGSGSAGSPESQEAAMAEVAALVKSRASFLLSLSAPAAASQSVAASASAAVAKKRWQLAAAKASQPADDSPSLIDVVEEAQLASDLRSLIDQRASSLLRLREHEGKAPGVADLARKFCGEVNGQPLADLAVALGARQIRASWRAAGLRLAVQLLRCEDVSSSPASLGVIVKSLTTAFQAISYHPSHKLSGAGDAVLAGVRNSFAQLLGALGAILNRQLDDEAEAFVAEFVAAHADSTDAAAAAASSLSDGIPMPPKPAVLSRFESTVSEGLPGGKPPLSRAGSSGSAASGSSRSIRPRANVWLPLFGPDQIEPLGWPAVFSAGYDGSAPIPLSPDQLNTLWHTYAPRNGRDMARADIAACIVHLREALRACMPAVLQGIEMREAAGERSVTLRDLSLDGLLAGLANGEELAGQLAGRLDSDSNGTVSRAEFMSGLPTALPALLAGVRGSRPAASVQRLTRQSSRSSSRRSRSRSRSRGRGRRAEVAPMRTASQRRRMLQTRSGSSNNSDRFRMNVFDEVEGVLNVDEGNVIPDPRSFRRDVAMNRNRVPSRSASPDSASSAESSASSSVDLGGLFGVDDGDPAQSDEEPEVEESETVTDAAAERRELILSLFRAFQLHYRPEDHAAIADSNVFAALSRVLLPHAVPKAAIAADVTAALADAGIDGAAAAKLAQIAGEEWSFGPDMVHVLARDSAMSLLRVIIVTCCVDNADVSSAGVGSSLSPVTAAVVEQLLAIVDSALKPADASIARGDSAVSSAQSDDANAIAVAVGGPVLQGELPLLSADVLLPLSVSGKDGVVSANSVTGYTAPHVDLAKSGWSIGWRMYWPRADQVGALAPASFVPGDDANDGEAGQNSLTDGLIFVKGWQHPEPALRARGTNFQAIGARTVPGQRLQAFISLSGGESVAVTTGSAIKAGKWSDVVVSFDGAEKTMCVFVNGAKDGEVKLPAKLFAPARTTVDDCVTVEGPHPYFDNMNTVHPVRVAGASKCTITFDSNTATEATHDYIEFFRDETRAEQFGNRYSGGRGGSDKSYPGLGSIPPLEIPGDHFVALFHSDGSNVDWGFKFTAVADIASPTPLERYVTDPEARFLDNASPFYFGRPPFAVFNEPGAPVVLSDFRVHTSTCVDAEAVCGRIGATTLQFSTARLAPLLSRRPEQVSNRLLDVLGLGVLTSSIASLQLSSALPVDTLIALTLPLIAPAAHAAANKSNSGLCVDPVSIEVRVAACRVLKHIIAGQQGTATLNAAAAAVLGSSTLYDALIGELQASLQAWAQSIRGHVASHSPSQAHPLLAAAQSPMHAVGLAADISAIVRQLIVSDPSLADRVRAAIDAIPRIVSEITAQLCSLTPMSPEIAMSILTLSGEALAALALLGGEYSGLFVGSKVAVDGGKGAVLLATDPESGFAVIALDVDPATPTRVPMSTVSPQQQPLCSEHLQWIAPLLPAIASACSSLFSSRVTAQSRLPSPLQGIVADLQARAGLVLSQLAKSANASQDVPASASAALQQCLASLLPALTDSAADMPLCLHEAQGDLTANLSVTPPGTIAESSSLVSQLLMAVYPGPRGISGTLAVENGRVALSESVYPLPGAKKAVAGIPKQCAFKVDDIVCAVGPVAGLEGRTGGYGVVRGVAEGFSVDEATAALLVDTPLKVAFGAKVVSVLESQLRLAHRRQAANADADSANDKSSVFYVADSSSIDDAVASKWSLSSSIEASRNRLWGFTVANLRLLASRCARDAVLALVALLANSGRKLDIAPYAGNSGQLALLTSSLYSACAGASLPSGALASDALLGVLVDAIAGAESGPGISGHLLSIAACQLRASAKVQAYERAMNPPPTRRTYESRHDYENNTDEEIRVCIPGATKLIITFAPECRTESGCDWIQFRGMTGSELTSQLSGSSFPGMNGSDPLSFDGDRVMLKWHTDGSTVMWGWRFECVGVMPAEAKKEAPKLDLGPDESVADAPSSCFLAKVALAAAEAASAPVQHRLITDILASVTQLAKQQSPDSEAVIDMARSLCGRTALLAQHPLASLSAVKSLHDLIRAQAIETFDEEFRNKSKSRKLKMLLDTVASLHRAVAALEARKDRRSSQVRSASPGSSGSSPKPQHRAVDPASVAAVMIDGIPDQPDLAHVQIDLSPIPESFVDGAAPLDAADVIVDADDAAEPAAPAYTAVAVIGNPMTWRGSGCVAKPALVLPFGAPCDGKVTAIRVKLSPSRRRPRRGADVMWFLMTFELLDGNRGVIWAGRTIDVDESITGDWQEIDLSLSPVALSRGHALAIVCEGADLGIACEETAGGVCGFTLNRAPGFDQAGDRLPLNRDSKPKYYGVNYTFLPADPATAVEAYTELHSAGVLTFTPPDAAAAATAAGNDDDDVDPLEQGLPLADLFGDGGSEASSPVIRRGGDAAAANAPASTAAEDVDEIVRKMSSVVEVLREIALTGQPVSLLRRLSVAAWAEQHTITLESGGSEGVSFEGNQLVGASSRFESESKGEVEESDTKTAPSDEAGGSGAGRQPYCRVFVPFAECVKVSLEPGARFARGKALFVGVGNGTSPDVAEERIVIPGLACKEVVLESKHPYDNNLDTYEEVRIPGATSITVTFDPLTRTENNCDFVRFFDVSRTQQYGDPKYTGGQNGSSPQQFPGLTGIPPLVIPSDRLVMHFHSDGSSVDWGYRATFVASGVKPDGVAIPATSVALTLRDTADDDVEAAYIAAGRKFERPNDDDSSEFGYTIRVEPVFSDASLERCAEYHAALERRLAAHALWTPDRDRRLVEWVQERVSKRPGVNLLMAEWADMLPPPDATDERGVVVAEAAVKFGFSVPVGAAGEDQLSGVRERFLVLMEINRFVNQSMSFVDLSQLTAPGSLAELVSKCRHVILPAARMPLLRTGLDATTGSGGEMVLNLAFAAAVDYAAAGGVDRTGQHSVFGQASRILGSMHPRTLRRSGQLYKVNDTSPVNVGYGLDQTDAGGPYRSSYTTYCKELQSSAVSILKPSPNQLMNTGGNRDVWVPNPAATSPEEIQMFEFLGRLFGIAIRNKECLNLTLPSLVWKQFVGEPLTEEDLDAIDHNTIEVVNLIRSAGPTDTYFDKNPQTFTVESSSGGTVELIPGGADVTLCYANRLQYIDALVRYRLHEYDTAVAAIGRGMRCMIPYKVLSVFNWGEVEEMVCGSPLIDAEALKKYTIYEGCSATDAHIQHFWGAFDRLNQQDRRRFVSFAYGRSRLPRDLADCQHRFKLTTLSLSSSSSPADSFLPHSHTCFFHVELPRYTSVENCRQKLLLAIYG